ncbi:MAG: type II/IV secretion system protein [Planctomycetes bacterium]|nr:type II/IV secretion system protein [Planctomycetota bacterium]
MNADPTEAKRAGRLPLPVRLLLERNPEFAAALPKLPKLREKIAGTLEEVLVHGELVEDLELARAYAEYFCVPLIDAQELGERLRADPLVARRVPELVCRQYFVLAFQQEGASLGVAMVNPGDREAVDQVQLATGCVVSPHAAPLTVVEDMISVAFGERDMVKEISSTALLEAQPQDEDGEFGNVVNLSRAAPGGKDGHVVRLVNHILSEAVRIRASDIHMEPFENDVRIRFRVDGSLRELTAPPKATYVPMVSRLKILSKMDIAERRIPQDGAFTIRLGEKRVDLRVSTVPTVYGEKMVLRLLNKDAAPLDLKGLGFTDRQAEDFIEAIESPHGLIFVTGPTGSGKTTTLYAGLKILNQPDVNIMTVEDPVEYRFLGINQIQVKAQVNMTFAGALRAFLRQDPDIIMVGEVRDQETAQICMRAALTGHLVLSTLHTNSALGAVSRLADMGIEPFLLGSAVRLLEAQRLVRRLCMACRRPIKVDATVRAKYGLGPDDVLFGPKGCAECGGNGYRGRVGVYEVLRIGPELGELIQRRAGVAEIATAARKAGIQFLFDDGMEKVRRGLTTVEEILTASEGH